MIIIAFARQDDSHICIVSVVVPVEIGRRQPHTHVRMPSLKIMQPRQQPFHRDRDIDLYRQLVAGCARPYHLGLAFNLVECLTYSREVDQPRARQFRAFAIA